MLPGSVAPGFEWTCWRVRAGFTTSSTPVDMKALAARYQNEDFWHRSMTEGDNDSPE
jgi:hypothetical protein